MEATCGFHLWLLSHCKEAMNALLFLPPAYTFERNLLFCQHIFDVFCNRFFAASDCINGIPSFPRQTNLSYQIQCLVRRSLNHCSRACLISAHCCRLNPCDCTIGDGCSHLSHFFHTDISCRKYSRDFCLHGAINRNIAAL